MVASIHSMGVAVNLPSANEEFACRSVIFMSPEWTPGKMRQAWKRVHRQGQTHECNVWWLYHTNTIEERMGRLLGAREQAATAAMDRVILDDQVQEHLVHKTYQELTLEILKGSTNAA